LTVPDEASADPAIHGIQTILCAFDAILSISSDEQILRRLFPEARIETPSVVPTEAERPFFNDRRGIAEKRSRHSLRSVGTTGS
jgi:hypothetical protein